MKYAVYDSETTIRNTGDDAIGSMAANPFAPSNFVVAYGELAINKNKEEVVKLEYDEEGNLPPPFVLTYPDHILVIGHNIPFDLEYMWKMWPDEFWAKLPTLHIWDTQQAAYLLSGQEKLFTSLNAESAELGLPLKDDRVKAYWDEGIDTPLIPKEMLLDYLGSTDLHNPLYIFRDQWAQLMGQPKLMELAKVKMDDILLTTIMTIHGMEFDLVKANEKIEELDARIAVLDQELRSQVQSFFSEKFEFNPDSKDHISLAVFGGSYKNEEDVVQRDEQGEPIVYKSGQKKGQVKTRKEKVEYSTKGFKLKPGIAPKMKNGLYSTEEEYLAKHKGHPFIDAVLEFRELQKDVSTYYRGYSKLVFPDGKLHPQYNHSSVVTGRQSCEKPNLQNVTRDDE